MMALYTTAVYPLTRDIQVDESKFGIAEDPREQSLFKPAFQSDSLMLSSSFTADLHCEHAGDTLEAQKAAAIKPKK